MTVIILVVTLAFLCVYVVAFFIVAQLETPVVQKDAVN